MMNHTRNSRHRSQRGAALIVGLLLLLVMTIAGISSMSTTTLQERMAGNTRQTHVAMQAAESALRDAEADLQAAETALLTTGATWRGTSIDSVDILLGLFASAAGGTEGLYSQATPPTVMAPAFAYSADDADWTGGDTDTISTAIGNLTQQPRYIIEYVGRIGEPPLDPNSGEPDIRAFAFRITAIGWGEGATPTSRYMLQSHFRLNLL